MPLIDDEGKLFGVVNVIDALVVVLFLAVIVAGIAVVSSGSGGEPETRYATIELDQQPDYVIDRIADGDVAAVEGSSEPLTITDVYTIRTGEQNGSAMIRVEVPGELREDDHGRDVFYFAGDPFRLGTSLQLDLGMVVTEGVVVDVSPEEPNLESAPSSTSFVRGNSSTTVEVEVSNVSPAVADALEEGMTETVQNETIATVESVESEPATVILESEDGDIHEREHPQNMDVTLTVELRVDETESGVHYRGSRLAIGTPIVFDFETVTVDGEVTRLE